MIKKGLTSSWIKSLHGCTVSFNLSPHSLQKHCGGGPQGFRCTSTKHSLPAAHSAGFVTAVLALMFYAAQIQKKLSKGSLKNLDGVTDLEYSRSEVIDSSFPWMLPRRHTKLFSFFQKVNELLQNLLGVPPFTVILPWYSQWNITVYVRVVRMERKYAFLNKTWMQILFRMDFMFAALGGLALMKIMCVLSCFTHCKSQMAGIMFFQFNKVIHLISGERWVRAQP